MRHVCAGNANAPSGLVMRAAVLSLSTRQQAGGFFTTLHVSVACSKLVDVALSSAAALSCAHTCLCAVLNPACQVEKNTGQQYHTKLSLNDCLDLAVERCGIYFRKIEIRQTDMEQQVLLLSSLEAMWQGQRKGSTAALKTNSGSTISGKKGRAKRRQSPNPSNGVVSDSGGCVSDRSNGACLC